jgi:fumarylacetoacetate (FAA) hydrolase
MKLATVANGTRDGTLVVVSRDLRTAVHAAKFAATMQQALDRWSSAEPELRSLYDALNAGMATSAFAFDQSKSMAPLPRAFQWIDGSVYVSHYHRIKRSMGLSEEQAPPPAIPLMYQGSGDDFRPPQSDIEIAEEDYGIDYELELAVITDDVPMHVTPAEAGKHVKLVALLNDVSLRSLINDELATGFGPITAKPSSSFAPVFVTPDELGDRWNMKGICLPACAAVNGKTQGSPLADGMLFGFDELIARASKTRRLGAGTVIGSGTVSSPEPDVGFCCIAERRAVEVSTSGWPQTPFLKFGDTVRLWMDHDGVSVFGAIEQRIVKYNRKAA